MKPYHAKKAITDPIGLINDYKYKVAIPAPSLYGQLKSAPSRDHILTALKMCGFDDVFEVARAAPYIFSMPCCSKAHTSEVSKSYR